MSVSESNVLSAVFGWSGLARYLERSVASLYRDDARGLLPAGFRLGNRRRWSRAEIDAWIAAGAPPQKEWQARQQARAGK
jgi:predicted DNA-binding transcriptional regulator AlpA